MLLDREGFAVSTGSACSSEDQEASHVLTAMGRTPLEARGAVRFSLGRDNTPADIDRLMAHLPGIIGGCRCHRSGRGSDAWAREAKSPGRPGCWPSGSRRRRQEGGAVHPGRVRRVEEAAANLQVIPNVIPWSAWPYLRDNWDAKAASAPTAGLSGRLLVGVKRLIHR
jgi:hypothetical protein